MKNGVRCLKQFHFNTANGPPVLKATLGTSYAKALECFNTANGPPVLKVFFKQKSKTQIKGFNTANGPPVLKVLLVLMLIMAIGLVSIPRTAHRFSKKTITITEETLAQRFQYRERPTGSQRTH